MYITQGIRRYWTTIARFSPNARLFLWSNVLGGMVLNIYDLLFNFYLTSLGYSADFLGQMASLTQVVTFVASLPSGMVSDFIGHKRTLLLAIVLITLALLGYVLFPSTLGIVAMCALLGIGSAMFIVVAPPFMMENSQAEERTHLFSINQALLAGTGIAGGLVGGSVPRWLGAWFGVDERSVLAYQGALVVTTILSALSLLPLLRVQSQAQSKQRLVRHPLTGLNENRALFFKMLFPNLLIALGAGLFIPFRNIFFRDRFGVSDSEVGIIFSLTAIVSALVIALGPVTAQRFGKVRAVVAQQGLSVPLIFVMGFAPSYPIVVMASLFRTALMQMSGPVFSAYMMEVTPERARGAASSLMNMVWTLGWVITAPISGYLQLYPEGWHLIFIAMAALYAVGNVLMWWYFGRSPVSKVQSSE